MSDMCVRHDHRGRCVLTSQEEKQFLSWLKTTAKAGDWELYHRGENGVRPKSFLEAYGDHHDPEYINRRSGMVASFELSPIRPHFFAGDCPVFLRSEGKAREILHDIVRENADNAFRSRHLREFSEAMYETEEVVYEPPKLTFMKRIVLLFTRKSSPALITYQRRGL